MSERGTGKPLAFQQLFEAHRDALRLYAHRIVRSHATAEDVVQDVFFRLWRVWDRIEIGPGTRAYLYATTRSRALNHIKHVDAQERRQMSHIRLTDRGEATGPAEDSGTDAEEIVQVIERVLAGMPPRQREVAALRLRHQLTTKQIATRLSISPRTVEVHIARATKALREQLPALLSHAPGIMPAP